MKNFKKITLGLLGATLLSAGLYSCSNDDAATTNTTTEQTNNLKGKLNSNENEETRFMLATGMGEFVETIRPIYSEGISYDQFQNQLGIDTDALTVEGDNLLKATYNILKNSETRESIVANYSGIEYAAALIQQEAGNNIFGATSSLISVSNSTGGCAWWELGCHVDKWFGDGTFKQGLDKIAIFLCKALGGNECD